MLGALEATTMAKTRQIFETNTFGPIATHYVVWARFGDASGTLGAVVVPLAALFGEEALRVQLEPAISTNPYFAFPLRVEKSGPIEFEWLLLKK